MRIQNQICRPFSVGLAGKARPGMLAVALAVLAVASGCSRGSDGEQGMAPLPPASPPSTIPSPISGHVVVTDGFGAPVSGAEVTLLRGAGGLDPLPVLTDQDGLVYFPAGRLGDPYGAVASAPDLYGETYEGVPIFLNEVAFAVTLHPTADRTGGLGRVAVKDISDDGRSLQFQARLWVIDHNAARNLEDWNLGAVSVLACEPDSSNDTAGFVADCVEGAPGFDASYEESPLTGNLVDPDPAPEGLAISLLLDQGGSVIVNDPADRRLFAAKYLQTRLVAGDQVAVAAFAADDASTGQPALLPSQPVTIFPIGDPGFTADAAESFAVIDSLATLEGGTSPQLAAIEGMLEFTASAAAAGSRRGLVVLASGADQSCGSQETCLASQQALIEASAAKGVQLIAVGLPDEIGRIDRKALAAYAQSDYGAVFWAHDPRQVATIFGRLPEILGDRHLAVDVTIELQSPTGGAFAPGHTVSGTLRMRICPWDCDESVDIPFALRIP